MASRPITGAVNTELPQHFPKLFSRDQVACIVTVDKTCVDVFDILHIYLDNLLESEIWSGAKPYFVSSGFSSTVSRYLFSRHLIGIYFQERLRREVPR